MAQTRTVGDGKTFATMQGALDDITGNLSGLGFQTVGVYPKAAGYIEDPDSNTGFSGTSETDRIRLMAMVSNEGQRATGIIVTSAGSDVFMFDLTAYTIMSGFGLTGSNATMRYVVNVNGTGCRITGNVFYDTGSSHPTGDTRNIQAAWLGTIIYNNIMINLRQTNASGSHAQAIVLDTTGAGTTICSNNSIYKVTAANGPSVKRGIRILNNANITVENNYVGDVEDIDFSFQGTNPTSNNNISSDTSANDGGGSDHLEGKAATDQFVSIAGGSEDLHLKAGADCIDAGKDLSGTFTDDIDGATRSTPWDVGADELSDGIIQRAMYHYRKRRA